MLSNVLAAIGSAAEGLARAIQSPGAQEHAAGRIDLSRWHAVRRVIGRVEGHYRDAGALQQCEHGLKGEVRAGNEERCPRRVVAELAGREHSNARAAQGGEGSSQGVAVRGSHDPSTQTTVQAHHSAYRGSRRVLARSARPGCTARVSCG